MQLFTCTVLPGQDLHMLLDENQKLWIQLAERKEFVCAAAKGSICCVIVAHGLLPSLIKQSRAVHPKSAALMTFHQSPAACRLDAVPAPEVIHCLLWKREVQTKQPLAIPCCSSAGLLHVHLCWLGVGVSAMGVQTSCLGQASGMVFPQQKGKLESILYRCTLVMYLHLLPSWLFSTACRWGLKRGIRTLWMTQSPCFFLPSSSTGYRYASIVGKHAENHGIIGSLRLEKTSKIMKSNQQPSPPCPLTMSLSAISLCFLKTFGVGDCSTSLGSLCQWLTAPSEKKFFLISNMNLPWPNLKPFHLVLSLLPGRRA